MKYVAFAFSLFLLIFTGCSDSKYEFMVYSQDPDAINIESVVTAKDIEIYPHLSQKTDKDWLLLFYLCADADKIHNTDPNPNDEMFRQMAQIGRGLKKIRKYDGTSPKSNYANVTAVGLWDGYNVEKELTYYLPYTYAFEFKYPSQTYTSEIVQDVNNFTIDKSPEIMSSENNWIGELHEMNMAKTESLSAFLSWALAEYNSDNSKEVALIIAGTGGGSFGDETGTYIPPSARSTCSDQSSESFYLSATDIVTALTANGFSSSNKLPLLIIDSSFSASLEDAFEYRNTVLSLVASPSEIPFASIDFNYLLQCFRKDASPYSIGSELVNIYANKNYYKNSITNKGISSLSYIDLSHVESIGNNVNLLADSILNLKDTKNLNNNKYSIYDCMTNSDYGFLLYNDSAENLLTDYSMFYKAVYNHETANLIPKYEGTTIFLQGYFYQFDLGYLTRQINKTAAYKTGAESIYYYCDEIQEAMKKAVVSCWRNGTGNKSGLYNSIDSDSAFGLTITGPARELSGCEGDYFQPYNATNFSFKDYKESGNESKNNWKNLLESLFPEQFKDITEFIHYL
ncbi:MAG: hypothetical protein K6F15_07385 [Treponema sp.]|nr:hypothetical protein [Treponema sp.]